MDRPPIEIARCCFQPAEYHHHICRKSTNHLYLEPLEAEVKSNDGKGCKDADGGGVVGIHSPFHPTNLHLFFLNQDLVSAMSK